MRQILFFLHANHNLPITRTDLKLMENDHATLFLVTFRIDISLAKMSKEFIIYHDLSHISTAERFARKIGNRRTLFFSFLSVSIDIGYTKYPRIIPHRRISRLIWSRLTKTWRDK